MQRFLAFYSPACRSLAAVAAGFALSVTVGCAAASYAPGPEFQPGTHTYLRADDSTAYAECVSMCTEETALALVTRTGCLEGCEDARTTFPLHDKAFTSRKECLDALLREDLVRAEHIASMKRACDAKWSHVHNRKGCYLAAERFYASLTPANICGSDAAASARYAEDLERARQAPPAPEPVPAPGPQAAPLPDEPPAEAKTGQAEPPAAAQPKEGPPVTYTTQPAGPLVPPPYTAPAPSGDAGAVPAIHDTPKYQKTPSAAGQPRGETTPSAKRIDERAAKEAPLKAAKPAAPQAPENAVKPAPEKGTEPAKSVAPSVPGGGTPLPQKTPEVTKRPQAAPVSPPQKAPDTKPAPGGPQRKAPVSPAPSVEQTPAKSGETPATPRETGPQTALPQTGGEAAPFPAAPGETKPSGENGGAPARIPFSIPEWTEPPAQGSESPSGGSAQNGSAPQPGATIVRPPVPSMLDRPYTAPTIIAPQIDNLPESGGR